MLARISVATAYCSSVAVDASGRWQTGKGVPRLYLRVRRPLIWNPPFLSSLGTCRRSATDIHPAAHLPRTAFEDLDSRLDAPNLVRRFHGRDRAAVLQSGCAASPSSFSTIDATRRRRLAGRLPGFRT